MNITNDLGLKILMHQPSAPIVYLSNNTFPPEQFFNFANFINSLPLHYLKLLHWLLQMAY